MAKSDIKDRCDRCPECLSIHQKQSKQVRDRTVDGQNERRHTTCSSTNLNIKRQRLETTLRRERKRMHVVDRRTAAELNYKGSSPRHIWSHGRISLTNRSSFAAPNFSGFSLHHNVQDVYEFLIGMLILWFRES